MAQAARTQRSLLSLLNSDGQDHPVENTFAVVTLVLGVIAVVSTLSPSLHVLSSWAGLIGIGTGLWGQFISSTTGERFLLIIGLGASALGFYLGVAFGGLIG
ncbi:hypothetical protein AB0C96_02050 [Streptomyces sp. NPDC048506]|uniref:hypothetical protein n=1 Tax=Streptomyces sp. NPDC048506 TaxID=3155028 RepID=UPI003427DD36